jgi:hypothetical protein
MVASLGYHDPIEPANPFATQPMRPFPVRESTRSAICKFGHLRGALIENCDRKVVAQSGIGISSYSPEARRLPAPCHSSLDQAKLPLAVAADGRVHFTQRADRAECPDGGQARFLHALRRQVAGTQTSPRRHLGDRGLNPTVVRAPD